MSRWVDLEPINGWKVWEYSPHFAAKRDKHGGIVFIGTVVDGDPDKPITKLPGELNIGPTPEFWMPDAPDSLDVTVYWIDDEGFVYARRDSMSATKREP